jgi:hypothetical protein
MRLIDDAPRIEVKASWSHRTTVAPGSVVHAGTGAPGDDILRTFVRIVRGEGVTIEQIAAEQNADEHRTPMRVCGDSLKSIEVPVGRPPEIARVTAPEQPVGAPRYRVFELPAEEFSGAPCPVIVKVVAVDRRGCRATGWATVAERAPQQVAALAAPRR